MRCQSSARRLRDPVRERDAAPRRFLVRSPRRDRAARWRLRLRDARRESVRPASSPIAAGRRTKITSLPIASRALGNGFAEDAHRLVDLAAESRPRPTGCFDARSRSRARTRRMRRDNGPRLRRPCRARNSAARARATPSFGILRETFERGDFRGVEPDRFQIDQAEPRLVCAIAAERDMRRYLGCGFLDAAERVQVARDQQDGRDGDWVRSRRCGDRRRALLRAVPACRAGCRGEATPAASLAGSSHARRNNANAPSRSPMSALRSPSWLISVASTGCSASLADRSHPLARAGRGDDG